jgi:hypothetical protein
MWVYINIRYFKISQHHAELSTSICIYTIYLYYTNAEYRCRLYMDPTGPAGPHHLHQPGQSNPHQPSHYLNPCPPYLGFPSEPPVPRWALSLLDPRDDRCTNEISKCLMRCRSSDPHDERCASQTPMMNDVPSRSSDEWCTAGLATPATSDVPSRSPNERHGVCPVTPMTSDAPSSSLDEPRTTEGHRCTSSSVVLMRIHRYAGLTKRNTEEFLPHAMRYLPWPFFTYHMILIGS